LTDQQVFADAAAETQGLGTPNKDRQSAYNILAGRSCRDALRRVCNWHVERGDMEVDCDKSLPPISGELP
jgi:hypothetical protein